jgi:hypothetical protein
MIALATPAFHSALAGAGRAQRPVAAINIANIAWKVRMVGIHLSMEKKEAVPPFVIVRLSANGVSLERLAYGKRPHYRKKDRCLPVIMYAFMLRALQIGTKRKGCQAQLAGTHHAIPNFRTMEDRNL